MGTEERRAQNENENEKLELDFGRSAHNSWRRPESKSLERRVLQQNINYVVC